MKRLFVLFAALFLILIAENVHSQSITFCHDVDNFGNPVKPGTVIGIDKNGSNIKFLTRLPHRVGTNAVIYEIYKMNAEGLEMYERTVNHEVQPDQTWFWKDVNFKKDGVFKIYVYDGDRNQLTSGRLTIQYY